MEERVFHPFSLAGSYGCATGEPRQDRKVATVVMILLAVGNLAPSFSFLYGNRLPGHRPTLASQAVR